MIKKFKIEAPFYKTFKISINVSSDGIFSTTIPRDISELFSKHRIRLYPNRSGNMGNYKADTLAGVCSLVKKDIDTLCSEKEISRKKVIRYVLSTACSYAKRKDGDFEPNCAFATQGLGWSGGPEARDATHKGPYGFQVYANVFERVEYEYCTGKKRVEYIDLREYKFSGGRMDDPIDWLTSISSHSPGRLEYQIKEMDYTPERGLFFVNLYKTIFKINEQIKPLLEGDLLKVAIDSKIKLLGV